MPGARLTGVEGDVYSGKVTGEGRAGRLEYAGTVRFLEKDDADHRAVIDAKGRDSRGAGNASAAITAQLRADGRRTVVSVDTDLKISGKVGTARQRHDQGGLQQAARPVRDLPRS